MASVKIQHTVAYVAENKIGQAHSKRWQPCAYTVICEVPR
jgi:hypothetical protein